MKHKLLPLGVVSLLTTAVMFSSSDREVGWDFYEKGKRRARVELERNGAGEWRRNGLFERWYENGALRMRGPMLDDKETGLWHKYHDNGQLKKKLSFLEGAIHGDYESWYPNGQRSSQGRFENGQPVGSWKVWTEDGSIDAERTGRYVGGELVPE